MSRTSSIDSHCITAAGTLRPLPGWRFPSQEPSGLADCCLIIPTYHRESETLSLLENLVSRKDVPGEVIIADGAPHRGLGSKLRSWREVKTLPFELVYVKCPAGLTRQRNIGIDISTRPYVFFLDDDARPLENYFSAMRSVFVEDTKEQIGAVGGAVINEMDRAIPRRWRLRLAIGLVPRVDPMSFAACGTSTPKGLMKPFSGIRRVDVLPGCAFAFRRKVLEQHRFSQFFEGYSQGEDLEMSLRIGAAWHVVCCGDAEVVHESAPGGRPPSFAKGRMEVRNRFFIWRRHRPAAPGIDRLRFWSDAALLVIFDLLHFMRRPWVPQSLAHAMGVLAGACTCVFAPPRFAEPIARKQYVLDLRGDA
jgi:GT2 family glycosyltransferase